MSKAKMDADKLVGELNKLSLTSTERENIAEAVAKPGVTFAGNQQAAGIVSQLQKLSLASTEREAVVGSLKK